LRLPAPKSTDKNDFALSISLYLPIPRDRWA
jgi:hypothetical protein